MNREQIALRTERQNAARERARLAAREGFVSNRYTAEDQPEYAIEVIIIDNRYGSVDYVKFKRTKKISTYRLFDVINDQHIGRFGAVRGIREMARRLVANIRVIED